MELQPHDGRAAPGLAGHGGLDRSPHDELRVRARLGVVPHAQVGGGKGDDVCTEEGGQREKEQREEARHGGDRGGRVELQMAQRA